MITVQTARAVIGHRTHGGEYLYMNDEAKIASWLNIPVCEVKSVLDRLIAENVLRYEGRSRTGSRKFRILPASDLTEAEKREITAERSAVVLQWPTVKFVDLGPTCGCGFEDGGHWVGCDHRGPHEPLKARGAAPVPFFPFDDEPPF